MILLTDEERDAIRLEWYGDGADAGTRIFSDLVAMSAKAQLKKVLNEAKTEDLSVKFRHSLEKEVGE